MAGCPGLLFLLSGVRFAVGAPAEHAPDDPVGDAAARAIRKLDLQVSLPHEAAPSDFTPDWHLPGWLIYVLAAIAVGVIAYIVLDIIPRWRAQDDEWGTGGTDLAGGGPQTDMTLAHADALAARGFFVEAMHLLLVSLAEIRRRLRLEFADSLTSREILRRAHLPEEVTGTLRSIVTRVELSYFGGYPATQPDYDTCRAGFESLSSVLDKHMPPAKAAA